MRAGTLRFSPEQRRQDVRVTNSYKTWEPFVAAVLPFPAGADDAASSDAAMALGLAAAFSVDPMRGTLAPRGGANNACDPAKPYSDSATVGLLWDGEADAAMQGATPAATTGGVALVVKTEEEQWTYRLLIGNI